MRMLIDKEFFRNTQAVQPRRKARFSQVTIAELEYWHPGSVFASLLDRANWVSRLNISTMAKRLTRLSGRQFRMAVEAMEVSHIT